MTVTEFYDYRCPHCINIAPKVVALIRTRPDVRFVFKEMPIFGATSEHAARAALAAKAQGKDYVGLYDAFMSAHPLTDDEIDRIAAAKGVDLAAMNARRGDRWPRTRRRSPTSPSWRRSWPSTARPASSSATLSSMAKTSMASTTPSPRRRAS